MLKLEVIVATGTHNLSASLKFDDDLLTTTGKTVDEILSSLNEQLQGFYRLQPSEYEISVIRD